MTYENRTRAERRHREEDEWRGSGDFESRPGSRERFGQGSYGQNEPGQAFGGYGRAGDVFGGDSPRPGGYGGSSYGAALQRDRFQDYGRGGGYRGSSSVGYGMGGGYAGS